MNRALGLSEQLLRYGRNDPPFVVDGRRARPLRSDTLVIETTNFTDRTCIGSNGGGVPNTEQLKLTERLTRVDLPMIEYVNHRRSRRFHGAVVVASHDHVASRIRVGVAVTLL